MTKEKAVTMAGRSGFGCIDTFCINEDTNYLPHFSIFSY